MPQLNESEPMLYTLGQAAKATGKQKSTILDAIRNGRLSASRDEKKQWQIDPAELHRVYPPNSPNVATERYETPPNPDKTGLLETKVRFLEREVARLERTEADLREDRDHWRRQATALLTDQRQPAPEEATPPATNEGKGRLWQKFFGGK
jgi:hypothetical protein